MRYQAEQTLEAKKPILEMKTTGISQLVFEIDTKFYVENTYHYPGSTRKGAKETKGKIKIYANLKSGENQLSPWLLPNLTSVIQNYHYDNTVDLLQLLPKDISNRVREFGIYYPMPEYLANFVLNCIAFTLSGSRGERELNMEKALSYLFADRNDIELRKYHMGVLVSVINWNNRRYEELSDKERIYYHTNPSIDFTESVITINPAVDDVESILIVYDIDESENGISQRI